MLFSLRSCVAAVLLGLAGVAHAQTGIGFGLVGLADGQSLRINVLNLGNRWSGAASRCEVTVRFIDAKGDTLSDSMVTVLPGQGASVDLRRAQASSKPGRALARAVLLFGSPVGGAPPGPDVRQNFDCNIVPSLEVVDDASGRAMAVVTDTKPLPAPDQRAIN